MVYQTSVILVSYNPDREKLLHTLEKIVMQKDVSFEIIICDDGSSKEDYLSDAEEFLNERNFHNHRVIKNITNLGTVKNLFGGMLVSKGEYVFMASPGDYFYDENTLKSFYEFAKKRNAQVCYGDIVPYRKENGEIRILKDAEICLRDNKIFDDDADLFEQSFSVVMGNFPLGACVLRRRDYALKYTKMLCECSRFSEDISIWASSIDGIRVYHYDSYVVWYEYGVGQSSANNPDSMKRLLLDVKNTLSYFKRCYPDSNILDFRLISDMNRGLVRALKLIFLYPRLYLLRKKINRRNKVLDNGVKADITKF